MKNAFLPLIALSLSFPTWAQTEVETYRPGVTIDGVCYSLPRTALRITIETEITTTYPGELHAYAFRFLRLKDVPTEKSSTYTIKNVKIEPYSLPDNKKMYNIRLKGRTSAPLVSLTHDGILLGINAEATEEKLLGELPKDIAAPTHADPKRYLDQETLAAGTPSKMAELIALQIQDLRESRKTLIKGEADNTPKDGQQLQLMLDELNLEASSLEELFKGYTTTSTHYSVFTYEPDLAEKQDTLCRFSPIFGVIDSDNLAGDPIFITCQPLEKLPPRETNEDTDKKKAKMETGVYYNVPAREAIAITYGDNTLCAEEYSMGQFGNVEILSNTLFDKKNTFKATFNQLTGSIKKISE